MNASYPKTGSSKLDGHYLAQTGLCLAMVLFAVAVPAQNKVACTSRTAITLTQMLGYIDRLPESRATELIGSCRMGFPMDSAAIERLTKDAKVSPGIMDALNQATASQLTVDAAHAQVTELEHHLAVIGTSTSDLPFRARIVFLQQSSYLDPRALAYGRYDADKAQLTATLGSEEYRFDKVLPRNAETLSNNWKQVKVSQPYADTGQHQRTIVFGSIAQTGLPLAVIASAVAVENRVKVAACLDEANKDSVRRRYGEAIRQYNCVLAIEPGNQAAQSGLATAQKLEENHIRIVRSQHEAGEWVDDETSLMWTLKDNGEDINFNEAQTYCRSLRSGGYDDWHLGTLEEMKSILDMSVTLSTTPTPQPRIVLNSGALEKIPAGTTWDYHIKGGIVLSGWKVWSSTPDTAGTKGTAVTGDYRDGLPYRRKAADKILIRALCVRRYTPPTEQP